MRDSKRERIDRVQDLVIEHPGITLREIADIMKTDYAMVQEATALLRARKWIRGKRKGRILHFYDYTLEGAEK